MVLVVALTNHQDYMLRQIGTTVYLCRKRRMLDLIKLPIRELDGVVSKDKPMQWGGYFLMVMAKDKSLYILQVLFLQEKLRIPIH